MLIGELELCTGESNAVKSSRKTDVDRFVVLLETRNDSVLKQSPKHASGPACDAFCDLQSCSEYSSIHQTRVERGRQGRERISARG